MRAMRCSCTLAELGDAAGSAGAGATRSGLGFGHACAAGCGTGLVAESVARAWLVPVGIKRRSVAGSLATLPSLLRLLRIAVSARAYPAPAQTKSRCAH